MVLFFVILFFAVIGITIFLGIFTDGSKLRPIYDGFCKEYDKINRKD